MTQYVLLGIDPIYPKRNMYKIGVNRKQWNKLTLNVTLWESHLGVNDSQLEEQIHLGYLMKRGDVCLGYNLGEAQVVENDAEKTRDSCKFPGVVFVCKLYGGVAMGEVDAAKKQNFQLEWLNIKKGKDEQQ